MRVGVRSELLRRPDRRTPAPAPHAAARPIRCPLAASLDPSAAPNRGWACAHPPRRVSRTEAAHGGSAVVGGVRTGGAATAQRVARAASAASRGTLADGRCARGRAPSGRAGRAGRGCPRLGGRAARGASAPSKGRVFAVRPVAPSPRLPTTATDEALDTPDAPTPVPPRRSWPPFRACHPPSPLVCRAHARTRHGKLTAQRG